ncbi:Glyoxalase/bleomycin resistance protein/dioxygenase [Sphingobium herbicidovorans NBRC 16415]|jgi:predicted enzyme related to lactoylglutathione lyase|uniref:Glyoxalase/bleomycin resistance protein/dioxygenase n=1 Tax=Sphingobium herbicidovorans (strain ATCC 700291 / DSM 11019 / CCUG 56400 / KCTC 2939 / LMG 18315 / NBRC 16415 / MH) TaxID=1219045 RepID=A0A086P4P9_SPHHM|nr:VOC family protein [Sphingobium herbicidovorans]KFG88367.1 Glyoxalase/bleomycin resistance protein/dioxygenase [Sphingobium herbicidovorans NBRC 16415]
MAEGVMSGFSFTKLIVSDVDNLYTFYNRVFGLIEKARVRQGEGEHELDEIIMGADVEGYSHPTLVIQRFPNLPIPKPGEVTLGFVVDDVDAVVEKAWAEGGSVYRAAHAQPKHGVKVAFIKDSDGHMIEVVEML